MENLTMEKLDLYSKEVKYMEDLLILGIMVRLGVDLKTILKIHGEKDLFKNVQMLMK